MPPKAAMSRRHVHARVEHVHRNGNAELALVLEVRDEALRELHLVVDELAVVGAEVRVELVEALDDPTATASTFGLWISNCASTM